MSLFGKFCRVFGGSQIIFTQYDFSDYDVDSYFNKLINALKKGLQHFKIVRDLEETQFQ